MYALDKNSINSNEISENKKSCCGCEVCKLVCVTHAIEMVRDEEGFLYPTVDMKKCITCNKCKMSCPIIAQKNILYKHECLLTYAGYLKDEKKLSKSASGGAASTIAEKMIELGGIVYGVTYRRNSKSAKFIRCVNLVDLELLRGSKYIQSDKNDIYGKVKNDLESIKKVLFIGLPCEVAALKCFLKKKYNNLHTAELICHGPTSQRVQKEFVEKAEKNIKVL